MARVARGGRRGVGASVGLVSEWQERRWEDIELHARMRLENTCVATYEVRRLTLHDDGNGQPLKFFQNDYENGWDVTLDPEAAEVLLRGEIKWDGCSHNYFIDYIHACDRQELTRLGVMFDRLFEWALEMMPGNEEHLR
jgi:hypothetical protein